MSDVINVVIRARDEATKSLLSAGNAADALAEAQAEATKTGAALEQQAAETAEAMKGQAAATQAAADRTAGGDASPDGAPGAIKKTADAADGAAGSVGNLNGRVMTLRYNLADVAQQLAGGANPFMVIMQQGPEIAGALGSASEAADVLKAALGGSMTVVAAAGVAVAALVAAYAVLANQSEQAAEATGRLAARMEEAGARADAARPLLEGIHAALVRLRGANDDAALAFKELTGEIDKHEAAATRSRNALAEGYHDQERNLAGIIEKEREVIRTRETAIKAAETAIGLNNSMSSDQVILAQNEIENARARLRAAEETSVALKAEKGEALALIDASEEYSRELEAQGEAEKEANRARAEAAKRLAEMRREYDSLVKALEAFQDAERAASALGPVSNLIPAQAIDDLRALQAELDQLAPPEKTISDLQRIQLLLLDIERAAAEAGAPQVATAAAEQAEAAIRRLMAAGMQEAAKSIEELGGIIGKLYASAVAKAAGAGRAIGQVLGGDLIGVLSDWLPKIAGPVGAAIGGALQGLTALGEMGPGQVSGQITGAVQGIAKGLTNLPALIVKLVPDLLTRALPDLIVALVGLIPRLAVALVIELPVAIVRGIVGWWRDIGGFRGIVTSIADGVRTWWRETWDRVRAWLRDIFTPGDQGRGRRVSDARADDLRTMQAAAMAVTDPRGRPGQPTDARTYSRRGAGPQSAGPTLVIQAASLHPDVVPATLRDLDRMTRPGGLRRGTTGLGGT